MWKLMLTVVFLFQFEIHSIICDNETAGASRSRLFDSLPFQRKERTCHDFCAMIPNFCRNGGSCVQNQQTCVGRCVCTPGWTGKWCKEPVRLMNISGSNTDITNIENTDTDLMKLNTDIEQHKTSSTDVHHVVTTSTRSPSKSTMSSVVNRTKTLESHGSHVSLHMTNEQKSDSNIDDRNEREACLKSCRNGDCVKINDIYKCKQYVNVTNDKDTKECGPGFTCEHGVCDLKAREKNSFKCICDPKYVGQFCNVKCDLECGPHGYCDIQVVDNTFKCFCPWNYTGVNCSVFVPAKKEPPTPEEVTFHWYVVAASVAMVIVTVGVMMMLCYMMWRRRLVFMLKIVHYFQKYEDDDGKEFDAFVSYKSCPRDENFVLHQLYPKLENEFKFKLCMHFRDFVPGEAIANNIVKAIESSRRTIIVLSSDYVKSEWCRMEYQKAQHEMLKLKHKIIPVVLEDISEVSNVDKNLQSILSSVTYLEWPGSDNSKKEERFWKKLELSLPKKSSTSTSTSSSSESESLSFSHPVTGSAITSSETSSPKCTKSQILSVSNVRSKTDSPTLSSLTADSNSPRFLKSKRKDFRHFMGKLVRSKIFGRQDSNSSQAALMDEETVGSRSICGSMSESMLSASSESLCSTSDIPPPPYLNGISEDHETNKVISIDSEQNVCKSCNEFDSINVSMKGSSDECVDIKTNKTDKENRMHFECEKDHCEGTVCEICSNGVLERTPHGIVNRSFHLEEVAPPSGEFECEYCAYMRSRSDNNRVRITPVDGFHQLKIQKLSYDFPDCPCCNHLLERSVPSRGSMKERKDAKNLRIMSEKRLRVGSLPRNFKGSKIHAKQNKTITKSNLKTDNARCDQNSTSYVNGDYFVDVFQNV